MNRVKKIVTLSLLLFVAAAIGFAIFREMAKPPIVADAPSPAVTEGKVVEALYFHRTKRCYTCNLMEGYMREVMTSDFVHEEKNGRLRFQSIDVQDTAYQHYIEKYQLSSISLFLSLKDQGKEIKFENLELIWQLAGDEVAFKNYIRKEFRKYLEM